MVEWHVIRPYDYGLVQALWKLERFPVEALPEVAAEALQEGFFGGSLEALAGTPRDRFGEIQARADAAFREMGLPPIDKRRALDQAAWHLAEWVVRGGLEPYLAAREIGGLYENVVPARSLRGAGRAELAQLARLYENIPDARDTVRDSILAIIRGIHRGGPRPIQSGPGAQAIDRRPS